MYFLKNNFIIRQYSNFLIKYPLAGTALTSGFSLTLYFKYKPYLFSKNLKKSKGAGMGVGNVLCQTIMYHKEKKFEVFKVAQYSMFGLLISVKYSIKLHLTTGQLISHILIYQGTISSVLVALLGIRVIQKPKHLY